MARGKNSGRNQKTQPARRARQVRNESPPARRNASQEKEQVIQLYPELIEIERAEVDAEFEASKRQQERARERREAPRVVTVQPHEPKVQVISVQKMRDSMDYSDDYTENQFAI